MIWRMPIDLVQLRSRRRPGGVRVEEDGAACEEAVSPLRIVLPSRPGRGEGLRTAAKGQGGGGDGVGVTGYRLASGSAVTSTTAQVKNPWAEEIDIPDVVLASSFARVPIPGHGLRRPLEENPTATGSEGEAGVGGFRLVSCSLPTSAAPGRRKVKGVD